MFSNSNQQQNSHVGMSHRLLNVQILSMKNINLTNTRSMERALKDPRTGNLSSQSLEGYDNYTSYQCQCYEPNS